MLLDWWKRLTAPALFFWDDLDEVPTHRLHGGLGGLVPLRPGERTVDLEEKDFPAAFNELDDDAQWRIESAAIRDFLDEPGLTCHVAVITSDDEEILRRAGANPLPDHGAYELDLDDGGLDAVMSTNPVDWLVTRADGTPVLSLYKNWQGVFVYL